MNHTFLSKTKYPVLFSVPNAIKDKTSNEAKAQLKVNCFKTFIKFFKTDLKSKTTSSNAGSLNFQIPIQAFQMFENKSLKFIRKTLNFIKEEFHHFI